MAECGDGMFFREVDRVAVKGRETPVAVYQPLGLKDGPTPEEKALSEEFAGALEMYRQEKFAEAAALFQKILARHPGDSPSQVFLERCQDFQASPPPPGWNGVFRPDKK
jgi:adenylate cyclase